MARDLWAGKAEDGCRCLSLTRNSPRGRGSGETRACVIGVRRGGAIDQASVGRQLPFDQAIAFVSPSGARVRLGRRISFIFLLALG